MYQFQIIKNDTFRWRNMWSFSPGFKQEAFTKTKTCIKIYIKKINKEKANN